MICNFIFGSSGHAKELHWLMRENHSVDKDLVSAHYFVSFDKTEEAIHNIKVISELECFELLRNNFSHKHNVFIGIGSGTIRQKIVTRLTEFTNISFPNLIHSSVITDEWSQKNSIGKGNVIFPNVVITTSVLIGDFVHINVASTVSHDCTIGNYSTLSPRSTIAGKVKIGENVFIGAGATIIENITVCDNVVIGAGAVVVRNIDEAGIYVGVPAKKKI